ncbi:hypothetical protein D3C78_1888480 [compost metagenome]
MAALKLIEKAREKLWYQIIQAVFGNKKLADQQPLSAERANSRGGLLSLEAFQGQMVSAYL